MQRTTEPIASRCEAPAGAIDPAELQGCLDRAHELRAEVIAGLLRRGLGGMARLLRRGGADPTTPEPAAPPPCGGRVPPHPPAGRHRAHPMKESRQSAIARR